MVERRDGACFAFEAGSALLVRREFRQQRLEGDIAPEPGVMGAEHLAHPAATKLLQNAVVSECRHAAAVCYTIHDG